MRTVHRLSPLTDEASRPAPPKGAVAPAKDSRGPQPQLSLRGETSDAGSLLFALEDIPSPLQRPLRPSPTAGTAALGGGPRTDCQSTIDTLQLLLGPASDAEAVLHMHVKLAQEQAAKAASGAGTADGAGSSSGAESGGSDTPPGLVRVLDVMALAAVFSRLGYAPKVKSSTLKLAHRRGLQHQYLTVHLPDGTPEGAGTFIVDPAFREAFVVASPTPRYAALLESLDPHAAATKGCLRQAVLLLCSEMAQCFAERGLPVPPWRTPAALLARWNLQGQPAT